MATKKQPKRKRNHRQGANKAKTKQKDDLPTTEAKISELPGDAEMPTDYEPIEGPRPGR
jgi:hypothetical protein